MAVSGLYPYRRVPKWEVGPGRAIMAPRACACGAPHRRQDPGGPGRSVTSRPDAAG